ncbi:hypothetical protein TorRG33x02_001480, partial [Trema orientale]
DTGSRYSRCPLLSVPARRPLIRHPHSASYPAHPSLASTSSPSKNSGYSC